MATIQIRPAYPVPEAEPSTDPVDDAGLILESLGTPSLGSRRRGGWGALAAKTGPWVGQR